MKKLFAFVLCLMMMASLVACSNHTTDDIRGELITNADSQTEKAEVDFALGETKDQVYENKFIGIGCTLENNWSFYTDKQIMELNNYTADVAGEEYEKLMKEADLIYDMYAISGNQLDNININLEKINNSALNSVVISSMLEGTVPALKETYGNMGYTNIQTELSKISIEGKEFTCLYVTGEINGLKMYQKLLPIKCNGYMANITITTYNQNTVDSLIENFYLVK